MGNNLSRPAELQSRRGNARPMEAFRCVILLDVHVTFDKQLKGGVLP